MVDTLDTSYVIDEADCDFTALDIWEEIAINRKKSDSSREEKNRTRYKYFHLYQDPCSDVTIKYWEENGKYNPSRLRIVFPSVTRFVHGNNVQYLTFDDLDLFVGKMKALFNRAKIPIDFMIEMLIVESLDLSFNLLLPTPQEARNIVNAIGNQYCLNVNHPIDLREHGYYARSVLKKDPKKSTVHRNGGFAYSKTSAARRAGLFPGKGIYRFENKLNNKQAVTRAFGKNFQFIELFDSQEQIMKSCSNALKHVQITKGNVLMAKDAIMMKLSHLKPLRNQLHPWRMDNLLMGYELYFEPLEGEWDLLYSTKRVNWFRNRILHGKLRVLHAALEEGDEHSYQLYDMIMDEIKSYFNGTSPFCCKTE